MLIQKALILLPILFTALGDIIIGVSVFRVHGIISEERKIDSLVVREVHKEKRLVILGLFFIVLGLTLDTIYKLQYLPEL